MEGRIEGFRIRSKDSDDYKVKDDVFDEVTLKTLYKIAKKGIISAMGGPISTGKEANVFHAIGEGDEEIAIKIYRITTSDFRAMQDYLIGDPRFSNVKNEKKNIVFAWTKKEFRNLKRSHDVGVRVPEPISSERNILVMRFIGEDGVAAPRLKDVGSHLDNADEIFENVVDYTADLYTKADLVHSDLSEFNILYDDGPVLIDMGQAVTLDHPRAGEFLERDVKNVVRYFKKLGVRCDEYDVMERVKGH